MEKRSKEYELLYIIPATFTDEELGTVEGTVKALLEKNGASITKSDRLGKLRFAYPIKNVRYGHYILVRLNADTQAMSAIDMALRIAPEVLRHLVVKAEDVGDGKFEMVQFVEVNLDNKEDKPRRRKEATPEQKEMKAGVAALEESVDEVAKPSTMSAEELDKKIDSALETI